jgi:hypothetical protein
VRGSFKLAGTPGENKFKFMGRIGNRRLAGGRYRLVAAPHAAGKRGNTVRARFKIA